MNLSNRKPEIYFPQLSSYQQKYWKNLGFDTFNLTLSWTFKAQLSHSLGSRAIIFQAIPDQFATFWATFEFTDQQIVVTSLRHLKFLILPWGSEDASYLTWFETVRFPENCWSDILKDPFQHPAFLDLINE